jgi:hypothetical protein
MDVLVVSVLQNGTTGFVETLSLSPLSIYETPNGIPIMMMVVD